jgi:hypothetical protein
MPILFQEMFKGQERPLYNKRASRGVVSKKRSPSGTKYLRKKGDKKYSFPEEEISDLFEGLMELKRHLITRTKASTISQPDR